MKTLLFATLLFSLCVASVLHGQEMIRQELLTVGGVRYRLSGVNGSLMADPEGSQPDTLDLEETLAHCDELVAAIVERAPPRGRKAPFVRDRTVPLRHGTTWVEYSQRHQGYKVLGGGGRIEVAPGGWIHFAGLGYESETFPRFKPRDVRALDRIARWAVGRAITGPPAQAEMMIDPNGDAPARLIYYAIFPVREWGRDGGWQVSVDAVTGKVISSGSTAKHAAAASR